MQDGKPQSKNSGTFARTFSWAILLFVVYCGIVIVTALNHEPWRDEADPWLVARDAGALEIILRGGYFGSPTAWYLLLVPLAKLGAPYWSMEALNVSIGIVCCALIMFCSPFSLLLRALIAFSYLFLYEYPIVARSYALSVAIIFSLAAIGPDLNKYQRLRAVALAVLANTSAHGLIISLSFLIASFIAGFEKRNRSYWTAMAIAAAGIGIAAFQLIPPHDGQMPTFYDGRFSKAAVMCFQEAFFPSAGNIARTLRPHFRLLEFLLAFCIAVLSARRAKVHRPVLVILLLSYSGLLSLFMFKYLGSVRHWGFFTVITLYCLWTSPESANRVEKWLLNACLIISFTCSTIIGLAACDQELHRQFSTSKVTAEFLKTMPIEKIPVVVYPFKCKSILPYLPGIKVFYPARKAFGSYGLWNNESYVLIPAETLTQIIDNEFGSRPVILVTNEPQPELSLQGYKLLYQAPPQPLVEDERFFVYANYHN